MSKVYTDNDTILAPIRGGFDVTPGATDLAIPTRAIMVTTDDATVTGILVDQENPHTTAPLKTGVIYAFRFKRITTVSAGAVKGYY